MNSAFLNLAKNDEDLINDIKAAIVNLYEQTQKRETLFVAIEHNMKHLCSITKANEKRAIVAETENAEIKTSQTDLKSETEAL
jgi:hypothetical protein